MFGTIAEFIEEWNGEAALTQKLMDTLTDPSLRQPVSPDGRTLGRIAWHIVISIPEFLSRFGVTIEKVENAAAVPSSSRDIAESFRKISVLAADAVKRQWTDDTLKQVQNAFGRNLSNAAILSLFIKHMIHHRGQMTVLMRQAGLRIPGVYGPAKEQWSGMGMEVPGI